MSRKAIRGNARALLWLTAVLLIGVLAAACGGDDDDPGTADPADPADAADADGELPEHLEDDPIAQALGPEIINAAIEEGHFTWYHGDPGLELVEAGMVDEFSERFGISYDWVHGTQRATTDRVVTEHNTGNVVADVVDLNDTYMIELHGLDALEQWRPPAPLIDELPEVMFAGGEWEGYWTPVGISAQALLINTDLVDESEIPTSYWDLIDESWQGRVATRDPRTAGGAAWQMLHISEHPDLGMEWIEAFAETVDPFIDSGGVDAIRDRAVTGQHAVVLGGRAEHLVQAPEGAPIQFVVPEEGLTWGARATGILANAPNPNAAKVFLTWMYEPEVLQALSDAGRPVPVSTVEPLIPEMDYAQYPMMEEIPGGLWADTGPFFDEMERIFD